MKNTSGVDLSGFDIKKNYRGFSAECKTCFYVSETGAGACAPSRAKFGKNHERMLEWIASHEHTEYRSLESAKRQAHKYWRDRHPDDAVLRETMLVLEAAQKRTQMDRIEELSEDLLRRERCYICGDTPQRVEVRNDTREPGVLAMVVCADHDMITEAMWRQSLTVNGYRIPEGTQ